MFALRYALAVGAAMIVAAPSAYAQLRRTTTPTYPDAQTMPAGTCRVWIEGLPANRQPAATDCETARRTQPRNSRIIYGTRPTNVYGNRDPRSIPGTRQYDPRYDPRSSQYDPRLDPHDNGRWERERAAREREARAKALKKQQKEREKEWKKANKGKGHDRDDDRDRRYGDRDGSTTQTIPRRTPLPVDQGTTRRVCADANRDGRCDDGGPLIRLATP